MYCKFPQADLEHNFIAMMDVPVQQYCAAEPERCYFGNAPSLSEMKIAFNREFTAAWVARHLQSILATLGDKDNVPAEIIGLLSQDIIANYYWLTASEFMLFCSRVRVGRYGKLAYGQVSIDDITSKIPQFLAERDKEIQMYTRQRQAKENDREHAELDKCDARHFYIEWLNIDDDTKEKTIKYFGIHKHPGLDKNIVVVSSDKYEKLLEGEQRGYYKLYI